MNEFESHESSYDHQHKKRLKEMKQMQKDPAAISKARKAERKADEKSGLISFKPVKLEGSGAGTGFKKGGFKNAFGGNAAVQIEGVETTGKFKKIGVEEEEREVKEIAALESETDDEYEYYDPRKPTGCDRGCRKGR